VFQGLHNPTRVSAEVRADAWGAAALDIFGLTIEETPIQVTLYVHSAEELHALALAILRAVAVPGAEVKVPRAT
jgi:hypothetical protein